MIRTPMISFILTLLVLILFTTTIVALQEGVVYQLTLLPLSTTDAGMGTHSMQYNSPYMTYRHVVSDLSAMTTKTFRFAFNVAPMIPTEAALQTFVWDVVPPSSPTWAKLIHSSVQSSSTQSVIVNVDGSQLPKTAEPELPYIFEISGRVGFTYGQSNIVQYEDRILRVLLYMHYAQSQTARSLQSYFSSSTSGSTVTYTPLSSVSTPIPPFRLEAGEVFNFNSGVIGTKVNASAIALKDIIFGGETASIYIAEQATFTLQSPMYHSGILFVKPGGSLIIDVGTNNVVTLMSYERASTLVNQGNIYVKSGIFRIIGTPIVGSGNIIVAKDAMFEFDPQSDVTFGAVTTSSSSSGSSTSTILSTTNYPQSTDVPILYSEGIVTFISGKISFYRPFVLLATAIMKIGMSSTLHLTSSSSSSFKSYVIGGVHNGNIEQTNFAAMNELTLICGGKILLDTLTTIIFGATSKFDGLGRLVAKDNSNVTISIPFYDLYSSDSSSSTGTISTSTTAGIYFSGPQTERLDGAGFVCTNCLINVNRGGIITSTGLLTYGTDKTTINIASYGFIHFIGKYASNILTGNKLLNNGDLLILNGASVDFNLNVQSTTHIRALNSESKVYFSSKKETNVLFRTSGTLYSTSSTTSSSSPIATNPTHLFALFNQGILVIRDGVQLQLSTEPTGGTKQAALFYSAGLYNSGDLLIGDNVNFEFYTLTQSIEPQNLIDVSPFQFAGSDRVVNGITADNSPVLIQHSPRMVMMAAKTSGITQISYQKYNYNEKLGIINEVSQSASSSSSTTSDMNVVYGTITVNSLSNTNGIVKLYPGAGLTLGDNENLPIAQYITSNGFTLTSGYDVLKAPSSPTSSYSTFSELASVRLFVNSNKNYNKLFTSTGMINTLYSYENSTLNIDLVYTDKKELCSDQIILTGSTGSDGYVGIFDNTVLNIYTNLKTAFQTFALNSPTSPPVSGPSMNTLQAHKMQEYSTLSINSEASPNLPNEQIITTANGRVKYPYTSHAELVSRGFLDAKFFPDSDKQLGLSHPNTHTQQLSSLGTQQVGLSTLAAQTNTVGTLQVSTTTADLTPGTIQSQSLAMNPLHQRAVFPIISVSNGGKVSAKFQTINIIPVSSVSSKQSVTSSGLILDKLNHKYSPGSVKNDNDLKFELQTNESGVNLILYTMSQSSAMVSTTAIALSLIILCIIFNI